MGKTLLPMLFPAGMLRDIYGIGEAGSRGQKREEGVSAGGRLPDEAVFLNIEANG
jgi:hypothetical protein